jgi:hypothetical protein
LRDIIFLFGAGASYAAGDILPESPPLGLQLYAELARIYPGSWGRLPDDIREALTGNFETGMAKIHGRLSPAIPQLMREMAIYFAQFRPATGRTLYCRLVEFLDSVGLLDRVLFSTLNYDCVLEFSLLRKQKTLNLFGAVRASDGIPVWKLHGSCNFFLTGLNASPGILYSAEVNFEGGIEAIFDTNEVIGRCLAGTALAPVMCLYMRDKPLNVSPTAIKQLQRLWQSAVRDSTAIFCVGVNPYAADAHIWTPIAKCSADLYFIGSQLQFQQWASMYRPDRSVFIHDRFAEGFGFLKETLANYAA